MMEFAPEYVYFHKPWVEHTINILFTNVAKILKNFDHLIRELSYVFIIHRFLIIDFSIGLRQRQSKDKWVQMQYKI